MLLKRCFIPARWMKDTARNAARAVLASGPIRFSRRFSGAIWVSSEAFIRAIPGEGSWIATKFSGSLSPCTAPLLLKGRSPLGLFDRRGLDFLQGPPVNVLPRDPPVGVAADHDRG